jgi:hypothetical protein
LLHNNTALKTWIEYSINLKKITAIAIKNDYTWELPLRSFYEFLCHLVGYMKISNLLEFLTIMLYYEIWFNDFLFTKLNQQNDVFDFVPKEHIWT